MESEREKREEKSLRFTIPHPSVRFCFSMICWLILMVVLLSVYALLLVSQRACEMGQD